MTEVTASSYRSRHEAPVYLGRKSSQRIDGLPHAMQRDFTVRKSSEATILGVGGVCIRITFVCWAR